MQETLFDNSYTLVTVTAIKSKRPIKYFIKPPVQQTCSDVLYLMFIQPRWLVEHELLQRSLKESCLSVGPRDNLSSSEWNSETMNEGENHRRVVTTFRNFLNVSWGHFVVFNGFIIQRDYSPQQFCGVTKFIMWFHHINNNFTAQSFLITKSSFKCSSSARFSVHRSYGSLLHTTSSVQFKRGKSNRRAPPLSG